MFGFFRKKSNKAANKTECRSDETICGNNVNAGADILGGLSSIHNVQQTPLSVIITGDNHGDTFHNKDTEAARLQGGSEVKKEEYSVKSSVQSLLDIMGRKKNKNKPQKNDTPGNRTWPFQGQQSKAVEIPDLKRRVTSGEDTSAMKKSKTRDDREENSLRTPVSVIGDISVKDIVTSRESWSPANEQEESLIKQSQHDDGIASNSSSGEIKQHLQHLQSPMGAADSKQEGRDKKTFEESRIPGTQPPLIESQSTEDESIEKRAELLAPENDERFKPPSPRSILRDLADKGCQKKRVTFDHVIAFDDGDKVDDVAEESSLSDTLSSFEGEVQVSSEDENNDEMPHDGDVTIVRENESIGKQYDTINRYCVDDNDFSCDAIPPHKGFVAIEVENNENLGAEDGPSNYTVEFESEDDSTGSLKIEKLTSQPFSSIVEIKDESPEIKQDDDASDDTFEESLEEQEESFEEITEEVEEEEEKVVSVEADEEEEEEEDDDDDPTSQYESDIEEISEEDDEEVEEETEEYSAESDSKNSASVDAKIEIICDSDIKRLGDNEELEKQMLYLEEGVEDSAFVDLLRVVHRQMRGVLGQETKLADLQERATALHRVQSEVCSARKEAELVRQKLKCVESDLTATRSRNTVLLEQYEARTVEAQQIGEKAKQLENLATRLQKELDDLTPEYTTLKAMNTKLQQQITANEQIWAKESAAKERAWRAQFERLRSQGAESEEMLLADCEWKLRDVQKQAHEKCQAAEDRLKEAQRQADFKSHQADLAVQQAKSEAREQVKVLQQETTHLKTLLEGERATITRMKSQHAKDIEDREIRLNVQLEDQARRLKSEQKEHACDKHEKVIRETNSKLDQLKATLNRREAQYEDSLDKAKTRADWEVLEMRRMLDKADIQYAGAIERLQEEHDKEIEKITVESERRIKDLEGSLSAATCSARATLELVRGQLKTEHAEAVLRLKEAHKVEMDRQWEMFTQDKEQCLERMKAECRLEGEEEREKRDKQLLKDIQDLKLELAARENELSNMRIETRRSNDAKMTAEKKLSDTQALCEAREGAARAEAARQTEVVQREAKETIDHLTKKCACLSNLFEDMRSRWQQAPGESAQLRKALQDERARTAALRRQLEAISRGQRRIYEQSTTTPSQSEKRSPNAETFNPFEEWTTVRQKRQIRRCKTSPIKTVELPAVTVPVRIKHYNSLRNVSSVKNDQL